MYKLVEYRTLLHRAYRIFGITHALIQSVENATLLTTQNVSTVITPQYLITTFMTLLYKHAPETVFQDSLCQGMYAHHVLQIAYNAQISPQTAHLAMLHCLYFWTLFT